MRSALTDIGFVADDAAPVVQPSETAEWDSVNEVTNSLYGQEFDERALGKQHAP